MYTSCRAVLAVKWLSGLLKSVTVTMPADDRRPPVRTPGEGRWPIRRFAPLLVVAVLIALAYGLGLHRHISFETLVRNRAAIDQFVAQHGVAAVASYVALYIAVVGLSLPVAVFMTVIGGFLFGTLLGTFAAVLGALAGGTLVFTIARSAFGEYLTRRAGPLASKLAEGFRADAFNYLLFLRLVPVPFWLVNLAPALFGVRLSTFVVATSIGILPATVTFAMFGAGLGSVVAAQEAQYNACLATQRTNCAVDFDLSNVLTPTLVGALVAFGLLALVPVFARRVFGRKLGMKRG
jgi:uncharacterized membrane protein YdjX (TVP38/TMEM64 family)